ncbi:MAG: efflux RND transporter periplasmic adaptor subunit [Moritella sp.]|uniref:efflux RND transporter periplasmic adaptor subunit n=1 Tax=Moritella sp. TaxID=78556 RepID=UPI0029B94991|nr:efflux RND transporter periplasmic adaptor subunit [Moritella sp.]MDX2322356.1 efflux RND transporter periplasmic adaptor subunit [Moritella sp.]
MSTNKPLTKFETLFRYVLPLLVVVITVFIIQVITSTSPTPEKRSQVADNQLTVEVIAITASDFQVTLKTNGIIQPRSQAGIASQVSGTVTKVSPEFISGGFFNAGDTLLSVDDRDYIIAVKIAAAALIEAKLTLTEEQAKSKQAQRDWLRLSRKGEPNDLVLRKPQLASANASLASAQAQLEQAQLNLQRTKITAPYAGRVLTKHADIGQFVTIGTVLADIYATDQVEVRLPLNSQQQNYIQLPEQFKQNSNSYYPPVNITAQFGNKGYRWSGKLTRTEGALDTKSRQLYTVATIENPYGRDNRNKPALKIGQFVSAEIAGNVLHNIFILPTTSVYEGDQVIVFKDGQLNRKDINVIWRDSRNTIVDAGVYTGELLVTTPLNSVVSGRKARLTSSSSKLSKSN